MVYYLLVVLSFLSFQYVTAQVNPKRGIAFAEDNGDDLYQITQDGSVISWLYNWAIEPPSYVEDSDIPFVPMQWGSGDIQSFDVDMDSECPTFLLTYNEPDDSEQSNLDPTYAAQLWIEYIEPLKENGVLLGAPAVTSGPSGIPWLRDFLAACSNCTIDFIPFHWYGEGIENFYDYVWSMNGQFPEYTLWVTEFADTSDDIADVSSFLSQSIAFLDGLEFIERYSWFGFFRNSFTDPTPYCLLDENGNLNELGQIYVENLG